MSKERRRYLRQNCNVRTLLRERSNSFELTTENISRHGAFVLTDAPKSERQLVRLTFDLPDGPLEVMGMVARTVSDTEGEFQPGMGIDFFALSREAKDRWDSFVLDQSDTSDPPTTRAVAPTRRKAQRYVSCFLVRLRDRSRLREYYTRDISFGGTLLKTPSPHEVAPEVAMILVHPESDEEFPLGGRVVRVVNDPSVHKRGVAVQFDPLATDKEAALLTFIETGVNYLTDDGREARIKLIDDAIDQAPQSPLPWAALGQLRLEEQSNDEAIAAFEHALDLDPTCVTAHRGLYEVLTRLDSHTRAHKHLVAIRRHERVSGSFDPVDPADH